MVTLQDLREYMRDRATDDRARRSVQVTAASVEEALSEASVELNLSKESYKRLGEMYCRSGQWDPCIERMASILNAFRDDPEVYRHLGNAFLQKSCYKSSFPAPSQCMSGRSPICSGMSLLGRIIYQQMIFSAQWRILWFSCSSKV